MPFAILPTLVGLLGIMTLAAKQQRQRKVTKVRTWGWVHGFGVSKGEEECLMKHMIKEQQEKVAEKSNMKENKGFLMKS